MELSNFRHVVQPQAMLLWPHSLGIREMITYYLMYFKLFFNEGQFLCQQQLITHSSCLFICFSPIALETNYIKSCQKGSYGKAVIIKNQPLNNSI